MERSSKSIEELFQQNFDDYSQNHNQAAMWSAVEASLENKRKPWPLYVLIGLLLLSAAFFWRPTKEHITNLSEQKRAPSEKMEQKGVANSATLVLSQAKNKRQSQLATEESKMAEISFFKTPRITQMQPTSTIVASEQISVFPVAMHEEQHKDLNTLPINPIDKFNSSILLTQNNNDWSRCDIKSKRFFFFAELFGGINYPFAETRSSPSTDYNDTYKEAWESQRSPLMGYQAGVMLGVNHSSGVSFAAGLMYQNIRYRLNHELNVRERIITTDPMTGEEVVAVREYTRKVQSGQNLETFTIPIRLGYQYNWNKWGAGLFVGTSLHLNQSFSGKYLDPNNMFVDAKDQNIYRSNLGLSFWGGIEGTYKLNDHFELFSRVLYQHQGENRLVEQHPLELQVQNAALEIGGRVYF